MLVNGTDLIHALNQFRIAWLMGGFGTGKTLGSYALIWELFQTGRYRYVLGNSNSVWTDSPERVILRDETFVDALVNLDEAGVFLKMGRDADKFMLGLRKLNICILCPSVLPVASKLKFLQIQRILNFEAFGLPFWLYQWRLNVGSQKEKGWFGILHPKKLWGVYDTLDYPVDDLYLSQWFEYWMRTARDSRPEWADWGPPPGGKVQRNSGSTGEITELDELRGYIEEAIESNSELSDVISISADERTEKRRKYRH